MLARKTSSRVHAVDGASAKVPISLRAPPEDGGAPACTATHGSPDARVASKVSAFGGRAAQASA